MLADGGLEAALAERYAGWDAPAARAILDGSTDLATLADRVLADGTDPKPRSGRQERLENWVNRFV
jgi:xylose isomerase